MFGCGKFINGFIKKVFIRRIRLEMPTKLSYEEELLLNKLRLLSMHGEMLRKMELKQDEWLEIGQQIILS